VTPLRHAARWLAIAIAVAAVVDPAVPVPHSERPAVRIVTSDGRDVTSVRTALRDAGFVLNSAEPATATVLIADSPRLVDAGNADAAASGPIPAVWALDTTPASPNVRIVRADASDVRLPEQAASVRVVVEGDGVSGKTTELVLEENGIPVATARHQWSEGDRRWPVSLQYLPPGPAATRLRVRASTLPGETSTADNAADVAVPAMRGAIRTLILEAAVTWPAMFVRRALEGEPAFAVSSIQRAAKSVATRGGSPPAALTRTSLEPFEVVFVGGPDQLSAGDLDVLRWFVEARGGVAIFIPDRRPSGRYVDLVGVPSFAARVLDGPAAVGRDLRASELLIPASLPHAATVLAASDGSPVVFSARRGAGAVVFAGALDAWRQRATTAAGPTGAPVPAEPFARFWRELVLATVPAIPPRLEVSATPALIGPRERTTISVRIRDTEMPRADAIALPSISAHVVGPAVKLDTAIRLWPTAEPGVYEGEWRGGAPGTYDVSVTAGDLRGDATVTVAPDLARASAPDPQGLALLSSASGGQVFPIDRASALVDAMRAAHPSRRVMRTSHPMRSPWWALPFAALLTLEWGVRRTRGLR
jgi:hypothetical protein